MKKLAAILALAVAAACGGDTSTTPLAPLAHHPVLFVHGYGGSGTDWDPMLARFRAAGWTTAELHTISYGFAQSNVSIAQDISAKIESIVATTGATKVDIVAFSMGSLASRYYIRSLGGEARVDAWVSLAGPNHGTTTAAQCGFPPCLEMQPGSAFLTALNAGDETPGSVRYATWWSASDATIVPTSSVPLTGAVNTQTKPLAHLALLTDAEVAAQVIAFVGS